MFFYSQEISGQTFGVNQIGEIKLIPELYVLPELFTQGSQGELLPCSGSFRLPDVNLSEVPCERTDNLIFVLHKEVLFDPPSQVPFLFSVCKQGPSVKPHPEEVRRPGGGRNGTSVTVGPRK